MSNNPYILNVTPRARRGRVTAGSTTKAHLQAAAKDTDKYVQAAAKDTDKYELGYGEKWIPASKVPTLYKMLGADGKTQHQRALWPLPTLKDGVWTPGAWMEVPGKLSACRRGLHLTNAANATAWRDARCYEVEVEGGVIAADNKFVARKVRLTRELLAYTQIIEEKFTQGPARASTTEVPWKDFKKVLAESFGRNGLYGHSGLPYVQNLVKMTRASRSYNDFQTKLKAAELQATIARMEVSIENQKAKLDAMRAGQNPPKPMTLPPVAIRSAVVLERARPTVYMLAYLKAGGQLYRGYGSVDWLYVPNDKINPIAIAHFNALEPKATPAPILEKLPAGIERAARSWG